MSDLSSLKNAHSNISALERRIIKQVIADLLAGGFLLTVYNDGYCSENDGNLLDNSIDPAVILKAVEDEEYFASLSMISTRLPDNKNPNDYHGFVKLVFGNGPDVIGDYSTNLEGVLSTSLATAIRFGKLTLTPEVAFELLDVCLAIEAHCKAGAKPAEGKALRERMQAAIRAAGADV